MVFPTPYTNSLAQPKPSIIFSYTLPKSLVNIELNIIAKHVITCPRQFVSNGFFGNYWMCFGELSLIVSFNRFVVTDRKIGRLNEGPGQILVTVFGVSLRFLFAVAVACTVDATTVGCIAANRVKAQKMGSGLEL
ncbi:MAG: hypothetical protein ACI9LY_003877 [Arenicella sp.]|jgi:hypothetical protein